ncbi:MAG: Histone acetyltransferase, ELP3 family [Parcubacteria group bacterium GW2011_GWC2_39_14]|nr:MAG: Histone acetyltransferase, ELP3 family [Parcubacteria group bacterium GW2011_GWC2_39_14]KKR54553.1 MAG: Histone acetyltransferase, ELP3 family [Parcubacteria group bacterium GW2011_GWA2_40_23]
MMNVHQQLIVKLANLKIKNANRLNKIKRDFANKHKVGMISNAELLSLYREMLKKKTIPQNTELEKLLQKRKIRTLSGVAPIAVLTKPYPCPGKCSYCPNEKNMPKSYLSNEPAVMRAALSKFDPHRQVLVRLRALGENGHNTDKIELIIMGGTWSYFPKAYQRNFVKRCFDACNGKVSKTLAEAQTYNETAKHRIVALTLETRPDYVTEEEVKFWRTLGATKVELGVQALDDKILMLNKRGHGVKEVTEATKLFKQAGFKVAYHMMPGLQGATPKKDFTFFKELFSNPDFQPDMLKIYPTVVTKGTGLEKAWRAHKYKPYSVKALFKLLVDIKKIIPDYVRIIRLIRDIPNESILAGNKITNLRESLQSELKKTDAYCHCIRCREAREDITKLSQAKLFIEKYQASDATEYFLQFASPNKRKLYAFLRLRLPAKTETNFIKEINNCALVREVHTYGRLVPIKKAGTGIQNQGLGTQLSLEAEKIALKNGWKKIAVISGVGVRGFYRRLGYRLSGTYMTKSL